MTDFSPSARSLTPRNLLELSSDMMRSSPLIYAHANIKQNHSVPRDEESTCTYTLPLPPLSCQANCNFSFPICIKRNNST